MAKAPKGILVRVPGDKFVALRDGLLMAFFMAPPVGACAAAMQAALDAYLKMIPADALRWESIGASSEEWKAFSKTTIKRCVAQLDPAAAKKRSETALELASGDAGGEAPEYAVEIVGDAKDNYMTLFQVHFPASLLADSETAVSHARALAALLPYEYGYVSPVLALSPLALRLAAQRARAYAVRHPGYDVQDNDGARWDLHGLVRNAYWLTFLGPSLLKKLGGEKALRAALPKPLTSEVAGKGVLVRAGTEPEIGDTGKKLDTPNLKKLGKVLAPLVMLDQPELVGIDFADDADDDWYQKWLRRHIV